MEKSGFRVLVALFDSELLCSPPSNRATKRLACVGFVWQADMGDEYDIIIIITTTTPTPTPTATATAAATAAATATVLLLLLLLLEVLIVRA